LNTKCPRRESFSRRGHFPLCRFSSLETSSAAICRTAGTAETMSLHKANLAEGQIKKLKERLKILDDEIDAILLERIRDRDNAERYGRMIEKRQAETDSIHTRIGELENLSDTIRKKQATIKKDISMIDDILAADKISEAQLRLLIDHIKISETEAGLDVKIVIKAPFRTHIEEYDESGEVVDSAASLDFDFDRLAPLLFDDFSELSAEQEVS